MLQRIGEPLAFVSATANEDAMGEYIKTTLIQPCPTLLKVEPM